MRVLFFTPSGPEVIVMPACTEEADVKRKAADLLAPMYTPLEDSDANVAAFVADLERRLRGRRVVGE